MRRSLRINIAANFVGRGYTALAGIVFVPIYLHLLGVEGYGLFALLNSYMIIAGLLDLGFSAAITREIARLADASPAEMRDLILTISIPYCAATIAIGSAIFLGAPWLAAIAIGKSGHLAQPAISDALAFAGFALTLQLPVFLYTGGLAGLQRQDLANGVIVIGTTLRHAIGVALLWYFSVSVAMLMLWQAAIAALMAAVAFAVLWRQLPRGRTSPRLRPALLRNAWRFAASVGGITVLGMVVLQSDKIIVGALLSLTDVGHYMIAGVISSNLVLVSQPVSAVAFPRLAQLAALKDWAKVSQTLHRLGQLVALLLLPAATTIAAFPTQALIAWTGSAAVAAGAAAALRILAIGVAFAAWSCIPYVLILASGRTRMMLVGSSVSAAIALPMVYALTRWAGTSGAATAMGTYLMLGFLVCAYILRLQIGRTEWRRWLVSDLVLPQVATIGAVGVIAAIAPQGGGRVSDFILLASTWLCATLAAGFALRHMREQARWYLRYLYRWGAARHA